MSREPALAGRASSHGDLAGPAGRCDPTPLPPRQSLGERISAFRARQTLPGPAAEAAAEAAAVAAEAVAAEAGQAEAGHQAEAGQAAPEGIAATVGALFQRERLLHIDRRGVWSAHVETGAQDCLWRFDAILAAVDDSARRASRSGGAVGGCGGGRRFEVFARSAASAPTIAIERVITQIVRSSAPQTSFAHTLSTGRRLCS